MSGFSWKDDRFADQKYLDRWPEQFSDVVELSHPGLNVAPWNLQRNSVERRSGSWWVGEFPLVLRAFPLGVRKGSSGELALRGYHLPSKVNVEGKLSPEFSEGIHRGKALDAFESSHRKKATREGGQ